jgi:hypothetical protein
MSHEHQLFYHSSDSLAYIFFSFITVFKSIQIKQNSDSSYRKESAGKTPTDNAVNMADPEVVSLGKINQMYYLPTLQSFLKQGSRIAF